MNFIKDFVKENLITICLILLIIIIVIFVGIVFINGMSMEVSQVELYNNGIGFIDIEQEESTVEDIDMSKYHISSSLGEVANIYNDMLDVLSSQSYILFSAKYTYYNYESYNGTYNVTHELDLKNRISKVEGNFPEEETILQYSYWSGVTETVYSYSEEKAWERDTYEWNDIEDMMYSFMNNLIKYGNEFIFSYEENIIKNDDYYYKIIVEYSAEYKGYTLDEETIFYVRSDTMELEEAEVTRKYTEEGNTGSCENHYYFEYSNKTLEIPDEILNMNF